MSNRATRRLHVCAERFGVIYRSYFGFDGGSVDHGGESGDGGPFFGGWFTTQLRRVWDRSRDRSHLGGWFKTQGYEPPVPTAVFFLVFLLKSVLFQLNELLARLLRARAMESGEQESTCDECVTSRCCIPGGGFLPLCVELVSLVHTPLSVAGTIT